MSVTSDLAQGCEQMHRFHLISSGESCYNLTSRDLQQLNTEL